MGCVGLSPAQFLAMTPAEFAAVARAWTDHFEYERRTGWEQTRQMCFCSVAPFSKNVKRPQDVMRLPWDGEHERPRPAERSTRKRFEEAKKLFNLQ